MTHGKLEKGDEGKRYRCTLCGKVIPTEVPRINFQHSGYRSKVFTRICAPCIIQLATQVGEMKNEEEESRLSNKPF